MDNEVYTIYEGAIDPTEYPHDRLIRERVALLQCIDTKPLPNTLGRPSIPEAGKHYLAVSSYHGNFFDFKADRPVFWANVVDDTGYKKGMFPYEDFEIVDDPWNVMEQRKGLSWFYYNRNQWLRTRLANRDHSQDMVSEEYLREKKLALVQYLGYGLTSYPFEVGKQLFALSHEPDFTPGAIYVIVEENADGKESASGMRAAAFEILSDPLGLLDPAQTEWKNNLEMQKAAHPEWFPHEVKQTVCTRSASQEPKKANNGGSRNAKKEKRKDPAQRKTADSIPTVG